MILTGPTAVGKSELSVSLAGQIGGEIISADSMQVYRHMDIGSAKIMPDQMGGIPHHLIDVLEPTEEFNVVSFQQLAKKRCRIFTPAAGFLLWRAAPDSIFRRCFTTLILQNSVGRAA